MTDDLLCDFNSISIQLKDDPRIVYISDVFRCVGYIFVTNLRIWIKLAKIRQSMSDLTNPYTRPNITAGWLYNYMVVSGQFNSTSTEIEITDNEFEHICQQFATVARRNAHLASIIKDIKDPKDAMWELCYQFIIPIRLLASSIPHDIRLISLRKWINTIFILPFISKYVQQYTTSVPNSAQLIDFYKTFLTDYDGGCVQIEKFAKINIDQITNIFIANCSVSNSAMMFVRLAMTLIIYGSIDIIKHYCPNFQQCNSINKEFDGSWVNIFDPCHMEHIRIITNLQALVKTQQA